MQGTMCPLHKNSPTIRRKACPRLEQWHSLPDADAVFNRWFYWLSLVEKQWTRSLSKLVYKRIKIKTPWNIFLFN